MSIQFRSQLGHSVQLCRVTAPKDGYGAKQQKVPILRQSYASVSVPSLCLSIMKFWKKVFFWQLQAHGSVLVYGCETLELEGLDSYSGFKEELFCHYKDVCAFQHR